MRGGFSRILVTANPGPCVLMSPTVKARVCTAVLLGVFGLSLGVAACGTGAAGPHPRAASAKGVLTGSINGRVGAGVMTRVTGWVYVYDAAGRLVARDDLRKPSDHFRFSLRPGFYRLTAVHPLRYWEYCSIPRPTATVRAGRTTHVAVVAPCKGWII
jgi:hypothetical protein